MEYHPLADLFPLLEEDDFRELCEDIAANGQRHLIVLHEGKILDGRNRYRACKEVGVTPRTVELPADVDPTAYVISANLRRRHMDAGTRRALVARLRAEGKSQRQVAKELGVPKSTVARDAKPPAPDGAPPEREPGDDTEAVEQGRAAEKALPKNGSPLFNWKKAEESLGKVVRLPDELLDAYPEEKDCEECRDCEYAMAAFVGSWQRWKERLTRTK